MLKKFVFAFMHFVLQKRRNKKFSNYLFAPLISFVLQNSRPQFHYKKKCNSTLGPQSYITCQPTYFNEPPWHARISFLGILICGIAHAIFVEGAYTYTSILGNRQPDLPPHARGDGRTGTRYNPICVAHRVTWTKVEAALVHGVAILYTRSRKRRKRHSATRRPTMRWYPG